MPIVINGSGTITGVSTGGLPDGCVDADMLATSAVTSAKILDGTIANSDINASAAIPASKLSGTGKVLQVVMVEDNTAMTLSTSSWTDTGMSVSITPSSSSSKILCFYEVQMAFDVAEVPSGLGVRLMRDATYITPDLYPDDFATPNWLRTRGSYKYLDEPATTSAITYKVRVSSLGGDTVYINHNSHVTSLLLMEIAG